MNETDIKKCIKHGYAWSSCGDKPDKTPTKDYTRSQLKTFEGLHATKSEAQLAIAMRSEDAPDNDHAEVKCDMPETLMLNGKLHKRLAEGEPREIGDVPVDGSQTDRFGSVYYRPIAETPAKRDARIKALVDGYKAKGGPITKEQLTDEVVEDLNRKGRFYYSVDGTIGNDYPGNFEEWDGGPYYWNKADAEHAKWLDDTQSQTTPITPEQVKMLSRDDVVFMYDIASLGISGIRGYTAINDNSYVTSPLFFTEQAARDRLNEVMAAQAALDKAKDKAKHKPCDMPDEITFNGAGYRRLADNEQHKDGDIPVDGSQTNRFGSVYYRPIAETPEQRDSRIKALVEGYKAKGGPITNEQLTDEVRRWLESNSDCVYYSFFDRGGEVFDKSLAGFWCFSYGCPSDVNLALCQAFWSKNDAEHAKLLEDGKTQMTPITEEQAKDLREGDTVICVTGKLIEETRGMDPIAVKTAIWLIQTSHCTYYWSRKAAESALAKANPAPTEPEHKFPEIPAWCPPLLEGDVPLGFGHAFKGINGEIIKGLHASFTSINGSEEWNIDEIWSGTDSLKFYCSPRTSAVALLNYPWLAEEDKAEPVNTSDKWIERKKDEYPSPTDEWTWSATLGDQVPSSVLRMPDGGEDSYNAGREWVYSDCTRSQVPAFKVGYRSYDGTVLRARYRNPNYKEPTPVASHETPIGETQPKEVSTDETQPDESEPKGHILDALGWGVAQHRRIFETGAVRDIDAGKPRIDLIAPEALIALGNVLAEGAKHYGERNWEKGIPLSQFLASMMRHYVAVQMGDHTENHDEKMLWNAMAFVATASRINAGKLPATLDDIGWTKEAHALTDAALALAKGIDPETKPDPMAANPHCSAVHVETNGEKANG